MRASHLRFFAVIVLLSATALFLHVRSAVERIPRADDLSAFPQQLGDWHGLDQAIPPTYLDVLGPGRFLSRLYVNGGSNVPVDFFLAYFPSQKTGDTIHSPKNCLPGAGWTAVETTQVLLRPSSGKSFSANRYVIAKGTDRMLVLYWYEAHSRRVASEYWAKFWLVADAIRKNRTDGALVRIITPIGPNESVGAAEIRATAFAAEVLPLLSRYIPA